VVGRTVVDQVEFAVGGNGLIVEKNSDDALAHAIGIDDSDLVER
jgi:hypothetical protein